MGFSRHATAPRSSTTTSEPKVFTLYCRPLRKQLPFLLATALATLCCRRVPTVPPLFEAVGGATTGITLANTLPEDTAVNIVTYLYYYNGGRVAGGGLHGAGPVDPFLTPDPGPHHLYPHLSHLNIHD